MSLGYISKLQKQASLNDVNKIAAEKR